MIPYDILEEGQKSDQRFLEAEGKGLTAALHGRVFPGDANSLLVVVVTGLYTFVKAHQTEHPRGGCEFLYKLYLNKPALKKKIPWFPITQGEGSHTPKPGQSQPLDSHSNLHFKLRPVPLRTSLLCSRQAAAHPAQMIPAQRHLPKTPKPGTITSSTLPWALCFCDSSTRHQVPDCVLSSDSSTAVSSETVSMLSVKQGAYEWGRESVCVCRRWDGRERKTMVRE